MKKPSLILLMSCLAVLGVFAAMVATMFGAGMPGATLDASERAPAKTTAMVEWLGGSTRCTLTRMEDKQLFLLDGGCLKSRTGVDLSSISDLQVDGKKATVIRHQSETDLVIRVRE